MTERDEWSLLGELLQGRAQLRHLSRIDGTHDAFQGWHWERRKNLSNPRVVSADSITDARVPRTLESSDLTGTDTLRLPYRP